MIIKVGGLEPLGPIGVYAYGDCTTSSLVRCYDVGAAVFFGVIQINFGF